MRRSTLLAVQQWFFFFSSSSSSRQSRLYRQSLLQQSRLTEITTCWLFGCWAMPWRNELSADELSLDCILTMCAVYSTEYDILVTRQCAIALYFPGAYTMYGFLLGHPSSTINKRAFPARPNLGRGNILRIFFALRFLHICYNTQDASNRMRL